MHSGRRVVRNSRWLGCPPENPVGNSLPDLILVELIAQEQATKRVVNRSQTVESSGMLAMLYGEGSAACRHMERAASSAKAANCQIFGLFSLAESQKGLGRTEQLANASQAT